MKHLLICSLLLGGALPLGGCVAGMATSAVGMAVRSARGKPEDNAALSPTAVQACSARAAPYGTVKLIDMQHVAIDRIKIWGTTDNGTTRNSFECAFGKKITGFKLRPIPAAR